VLLFSGHMIDRSDRPSPRFPPGKEPGAAAAIEAALEDFGAGSDDVGITEGACGGDILFAEAMLRRGAALDLHLPFDEPTFIEKSVAYDKPDSPLPDRWLERYQRMARHAKSRVRVMPDELGPLPADTDPYERCNLWMLEDALAFGGERVRFICLWDGGGGDGPGGTAHMRSEVRRRGGAEEWIDIRAVPSSL
jgi:hypothetical protein